VRPGKERSGGPERWGRDEGRAGMREINRAGRKTRGKPGINRGGGVQDMVAYGVGI